MASREVESLSEEQVRCRVPTNWHVLLISTIPLLTMLAGDDDANVDVVIVIFAVPRATA